ncbi:hypothetical protein NEFER03_0809 [Nematocida sp. LUAm3]|nr:hypothetical protein NEFER03_0809 [Nematocida sp. LUAm3]KAI5174827.1 hypothetical protein NEFER02_0927 [Nematocida sp. LUAm2]KAI5177575.1 hypothetical protein NEFER01_0825 [Nematocida sp. LUAm1]
MAATKTIKLNYKELIAKLTPNTAHVEVKKQLKCWTEENSAGRNMDERFRGIFSILQEWLKSNSNSLYYPNIMLKKEYKKIIDKQGIDVDFVQKQICEWVLENMVYIPTPQSNQKFGSIENNTPIQSDEYWQMLEQQLDQWFTMIGNISIYSKLQPGIRIFPLITYASSELKEEYYYKQKISSMLKKNRYLNNTSGQVSDTSHIMHTLYPRVSLNGNIGQVISKVEWEDIYNEIVEDLNQPKLYKKDKTGQRFRVDADHLAKAKKISRINFLKDNLDTSYDFRLANFPQFTANAIYQPVTEDEIFLREMLSIFGETGVSNSFLNIIPDKNNPKATDETAQRITKATQRYIEYINSKSLQVSPNDTQPEHSQFSSKTQKKNALIMILKERNFEKLKEQNKLINYVTTQYISSDSSPVEYFDLLAKKKKNIFSSNWHIENLFDSFMYVLLLLVAIMNAITVYPWFAYGSFDIFVVLISLSLWSISVFIIGYLATNIKKSNESDESNEFDEFDEFNETYRVPQQNPFQKFFRNLMKIFLLSLAIFIISMVWVSQFNMRYTAFKNFYTLSVFIGGSLLIGIIVAFIITIYNNVKKEDTKKEESAQRKGIFSEISKKMTMIKQGIYMPKVLRISFWRNIRENLKSFATKWALRAIFTLLICLGLAFIGALLYLVSNDIEHTINAIGSLPNPPISR